jgi:hypothetical protein
MKAQKKEMLKNIKRQAFATCVALILAGQPSLQAQGDIDPPPTDGGPGCCDTGPDGNGGTTDIPMDAGLSLLLAAGVGFGIKKARFHNNHHSIRGIKH